MDPKAVHDEIRAFMKEHNINAEKVFRLIDDNKTGVISYEEFQEWLFRNSARQFTADVVSNYYRGFKEPVNHKNFVVRIDHEFDEVLAVRKEAEGVAAGIGMINEFLKINSTQMKKTSLEDYLEGKNLLEVMQQI
jgi:hypothetical protein